MNRIAGRAWALWLMIAVLLGGVGFFVYEYVTDSADWVMHSGSPHVYEGANQTIALGSVVDRDGNFLLSLNNGRVYTSDTSVRRSTLHWLGDRLGNIRAPALTHYANALAGFSLVNGLYDYGGGGGQATLTLSAQVQAAALSALGDYKGTVAVYNYKTGELLCAVTTPTYDPDAVPDIAGDTTGAYEGVYLNRFTQASYVPGSIFKIVTTAAALESMEGVADLTYTCTGSYAFGADKVTCERPHGTQNLKAAMMNSCNCYYAFLSQQMGGEKLTEYVERFGVLKSVTFDGIHTATGNYNVSGAAAVEVAWSAIGQHTDLINPCAYLTFVGAVANGGQGVTPYVMQSVSVGDKVTYRAEIAPRDRVMSEETAGILRDYMRNNVVNNYGAEKFAGLTVCAKSGTGEVDGDKRSYAMFTGFATDEAYPLAFIVCVENAGYGKAVCIPILSQVLAACKQALDQA